MAPLPVYIVSDKRMHRLCRCHRQDVQAPQYAETPRPSRPSPAPTHAAQLETGDPAATHVSAFSEVMGPLPVHVSEATPAGRCARSAKRDAASRRSSVSSRRLWGAHSSVVAGGHGHGGSARLSEPCGKGIAGSRPSGRSLSGNAIVARVARLGAGAPLSLGASTSNELLGAAEIRTPAFRRSARARGIVRPWRRPRCRRVGLCVCFHAIAQARVVGLTVPDRRALAYATRGVRRTASRFRVSSGAAADPWPGRTSALTAPAFAGLIDLG